MLLKDQGGEIALREISRRKTLEKNRVEPQAAVAFALVQPACRQFRLSNELKKRGFFISPGGARAGNVP